MSDALNAFLSSLESISRQIDDAIDRGVSSIAGYPLPPTKRGYLFDQVKRVHDLSAQVRQECQGVRTATGEPDKDTVEKSSDFELPIWRRAALAASLAATPTETNHPDGLAQTETALHVKS